MAETASPLPYIRTNLQGIPSWNPTATLAAEQGGRVHRMDLNECPYPPSPKVVEAIRAGAEAINRYPDGSCPRLSEVIAGRTGVPLSRICWGTGSSELLGNAIRIAVAPGDGVVAPTPLWRRFAGVFRTVAADVAYAENRPDGGIDVNRLVGAIGNNTRIVVCVTPNNPTGLALSADELARVIGGTPDNVLLYVDEAYYEFNIHAGGPDALDLLAARKGPWLVTRTFSKAYAMAGMRLGYALCSSDAIADALRAVTGTFNVSALSEAAGLAALDDPDYTAWLLDRNAAERARLVEGMRGLGLAPLSSVTNFVSVALPMAGADVAGRMRARGIRIATWPEPGYEGYIRVSIGLAEDTDAFLAALTEILADAAA